MAKDRSMRLGRGAGMSQDPGDVAREVAHEMRTRPDSDVLETVLKYTPEVRSTVFDLLSEAGENEGRLAVLKVLSMMEEQITFARENAIQPRKGDAFLPNREAILAAVMRELTPERAKEILKFHEAKLVLTPVSSPIRYQEELTKAGQTMNAAQAIFYRFAQTQLKTQADNARVERAQIKKWKFAITEGVQTFEIPDWDNGQEIHEQRIERFNRKYASSDMTRLDFQSYIALMVQGLRQGRPTDCEYQGHSTAAVALIKNWQYTILNEMAEEETENIVFIGVAGWNATGQYVYLSTDTLDIQSDAARFRAMMSGDIN